MSEGLWSEDLCRVQACGCGGRRRETCVLRSVPQNEPVDRYSKAAALGAGLRLFDIVAEPKPFRGRDLRPGLFGPGRAQLAA